MWIRYHIKCHSCEKVTNLRLQLTSQNKIDINFKCPNPNCQTQISGVLLIDYNRFKNFKPNILTRIQTIWNKSASFNAFQRNFHKCLKLEFSRGEKVSGDFLKGDYYLEYSDGIRVSQPNETGHNSTTPFLRQTGKELFQQLQIDKLRQYYHDNLWLDLIDFMNAYLKQNFVVLEKIGKKLCKESIGLSDFQLEYNTELGRLKAYFTISNHFLFFWIDPDKHLEFVNFIFSKLFENDGLINSEIENLCIEYTNPIFIEKFYQDINELLSRFLNIRKLFKQTYLNLSSKENIISNPNFEQVKSLYTDSFEFLGRNSIIVLKFINILERGKSSSMPETRLTIDAFETMNHGNRMNILTKCTTNELLEIFENRFDHKLRNGINHFKTKMDPNTQIISFFPSTNNPNEEHQITYDQFLKKTLGMIESTMRMNQIVKMFFYHNEDRKNL